MTWLHRGGFDLTEAKQVLAWQRDPALRPSYSVRARARAVFPSSDRPQGWFQEKVSELLDDYEPPFWKHFLTLRTTQDELVITPYPVHATDQPLKGQTGWPDIPEIRIRFDR